MTRLFWVALASGLMGCGGEVQEWCKSVADCSSQTMDECLELEQEEVDHAATWGCTEVYEAYLQCRNVNGVCANGVFTPSPIDACASASLGYNACLADAADAAGR